MIIRGMQENNISESIVFIILFTSQMEYKPLMKIENKFLY